MSAPDDGFEEIMPRRAGAKGHAGCVVRCTAMGRQGAKRLSLTFRLSLLDAETAAIIGGGHHFSVAFNAKQRAIRIRAHDTGRFEMLEPPKTNGDVQILRVPLPEGLGWCDVATPVEPDPNLAQRSFVIDLPRQFWLVAPPEPPLRSQIVPLLSERAPARPATDMTAGLMGDPAPGRSALAGKART